jgi:hypothetical protein
MGRVTGAGQLRTWASARRPLLVVAVGLAFGAIVLAPLRIAARSHELAGPTFSTAIVLPCVGATFTLYLGLPVQPTLERLSSRPMIPWRILQGVASLACGLLLVVPAAVVATGDTVRIVQNAGVFSAAAVVVGRLTHPLVGVAVPWLWAFAALLFGLSSGDLGEPTWAWWSWIVGAEPHVLVGLATGLLGAVSCAVLPRGAAAS